MSTPEIKPDITNLFLSIGSAAAMHMGLSPHPQTNQTTKDLKLAEFNINLLITLKEKTKGNLEDKEVAFLDNMISDLQMNYLKVSEK